jgi:predicted enzyme related to lactoylglutathione lyase
MQWIYRKINFIIVETKRNFLISAVLLVGFGMIGCAENHIIVPKITSEPTHQRLTGKFVWFDLFTHDLQSASLFYESLFGWSFKETSSTGKIVKTILRDGVPIANAVYIKQEDPMVNGSRWLSYISVEDVDKAVKVANKNNGTVYIKPRDLKNRGRVAIVIDPQKAIFGLVTATGGDPLDSDFLVNQFLGSELWTTNPDDALKFYNILAGYEQKLIDIKADLKYRRLVVNGRFCGGLMKLPWDDVEPAWIPYVSVKNTLETVEKAKKLGGKIIVEKDSAVQEGSIAIIADPSGAVFAIIQMSGIPKREDL